MAKIERVKTLEVALRDSKERGVEERQRYVNHCPWLLNIPLNI